MKQSIRLDRFDIKILQELQRDASISNIELSERVDLTAAPCSRRVKQLEELGVIASRVVRINERTVNLNLIVILHISMDKHIPERFQHFEDTIAGLSEVMECYLITGNKADYQLKIAVSDMDAYYALLIGKITRIPGVTGVESAFVLRKVIDDTALPLKYVDSR